MGDLDPAKVRAAVLRGLTPLEQRIAGLKSKKAVKAWEQFTKGATSKLLSGDLTVDEWKDELGRFGGLAMRDVKDPATQSAIVNEVNSAATTVEEAFEPPSSLGWLIFAGIGATAFAYWWMKREEKQRELPIATPGIIAGSQRQGRKIPTAEIEDAEFEEI